MFESVDPSSRLGCTPSARVTETAARTIGASAATAPARTVADDGLFHRQPPVVPPPLVFLGERDVERLLEPGVERGQGGGIGRAHVDLHPRVGEIVLTDVPPPMRPTLKVVFGSRGTSMSAMRPIARPSA